MKAVPIFDFHAHIFPEKVAEKAVANIGKYYGISMTGKGTASDLLKSGKENGVQRYIVHSTATKPEQVQSINDFIADTCSRHPELTGFGTLHYGFNELEEESERMKGLGLKGLKLHPDFQNFEIDDPKMDSIYKCAEETFPVLMHMGDENSNLSSPERLADVLSRFPDMRVIAAHLGGYRMWDRARKVLSGAKVYYDTCSSLPFLQPEEAADIIRMHGVEKVLFGSDYPMWSYQDELQLFERLNLTEDEKQALLWDNAFKLLGK